MKYGDELSESTVCLKNTSTACLNDRLSVIADQPTSPLKYLEANDVKSINN